MEEDSRESDRSPPGPAYPQRPSFILMSDKIWYVVLVLAKTAVQYSRRNAANCDPPCGGGLVIRLRRSQLYR